MNKLKYAAALLGGTALFVAAPAMAQDPVATELPDASDATADAAIQQSASVDSAQAKMELLQAQIDALQTTIDGMKAQLATPSSTPAAPVDIPAWIKGTSISGKAYANFSGIDHESDGADLAANGAQTELKRFYLGVDHKFNDVFSANLTTDFRYNANGTSKDVLVYVKKAYLQAKLAPEFFVRIGSADLPWIPFVEGLYGYRFVENTLTDRTKFGTSADWGIHIGGSLADGRISYAASAVNGAGYKTLSRSSNTIDLEARVSASPIKNVTLGAGVYSGKLGKSSGADSAIDTEHRATRWTALAAYTNGRIRAGVEYFQARNWNNVTTITSDKSNGWSAFGSFAFTPKLAVFGRYDWVKPNKDTNPDLKENYFNVGLNYKPIKQIDLALVYKRDRAKNGFISTSNGTIGGLDKGTYDELGLFTQLAF